MIVEHVRKVWTIERYGRRKSYFSLDSACRALARSLIVKRHPTEHGDSDETGWSSGGGFYWEQDIPRAAVLHRRLTRLIQAAFKATADQVEVPGQQGEAKP